MDVELGLRDLANRTDQRRTHRQIGDKMAVHDVDVDHGGAAAFDSMDFVGQPGKIGRKNGRNNQSHVGN